jgi:hypothetical protein
MTVFESSIRDGILYRFIKAGRIEMDESHRGMFSCAKRCNDSLKSWIKEKYEASAKMDDYDLLQSTRHYSARLTELEKLSESFAETSAKSHRTRRRKNFTDEDSDE